MSEQRERYDSEHAPVAAKSRELEQALAENERLRYAVIEASSVLAMIIYNTHVDADLMKSGKWAIDKCNAALKELDDA